MSVALCHRVQNADGLCNDFGADAIAPDDGNVPVHCAASFAFNEAIRPPFAIISLMKGGNGSA